MQKGISVILVLNKEVDKTPMQPAAMRWWNEMS